MEAVHHGGNPHDDPRGAEPQRDAECTPRQTADHAEHRGRRADDPPSQLTVGATEREVDPAGGHVERDHQSGGRQRAKQRDRLGPCRTEHRKHHRRRRDAGEDREREGEARDDLDARAIEATVRVGVGLKSTQSGHHGARERLIELRRGERHQLERPTIRADRGGPDESTDQDLVEIAGQRVEELRRTEVESVAEHRSDRGQRRRTSGSPPCTDPASRRQHHAAREMLRDHRPRPPTRQRREHAPDPGGDERRDLRVRERPESERPPHHRSRLRPECREHEHRRERETERNEFGPPIEARDERRRRRECDAEHHARRHVDDRQGRDLAGFDRLSLDRRVAEPELLEHAGDRENRDHHADESELVGRHMPGDDRHRTDRHHRARDPGDEHGRGAARGATSEFAFRPLDRHDADSGRGIAEASVSGDTRSIGWMPSRSWIRRRSQPARRTW